MVWYDTFNSVFWLGILGAVAGVVGLCLRNCVKQKCATVELCFGLCKIQRDVLAETREEMRAMDLGISNTPTDPNASFKLQTPQRPNRV